MTSVRKALMISLVDRYLVLLLALASSMILARLLTPEQIGVYSVSLAVIGIAQVLRDFGIGNYLIQEKSLTEAQMRTAFGISLLLGGLLFLPLFLAAPWLAEFYGDTRMVDTLRICSLNFIVLPFCSISLALLRREMLFGRLLYVSLAAAGVNFVVTVGLALLGWGPESMAWGAVASNAATGVGAHIARGRPALLWPSLSEWRRVASFGGQSAVTSVVTSITMDANDLVLGRAIGLAPVAILSRAQGLISLFSREILGAIRNVMFPAFAKIHREGADTEQAYVHTVVVTTVIGWTFFAFLALYPLEVMRLLYGPQWDESASLVPVLALGGAAHCVGAFALNVIMAVGRIDLVTRFELAFQIPRFAALAFTAVITRSLEACAWVYAVAQLVYLPAVYLTKQLCLKSRWRPLLRGTLRSGVVALLSVTGAGAISLAHGLNRIDPIGASAFASAIAITIASWLVSLLALKHPLSSDPLFMRVLTRMRLKR